MLKKLIFAAGACLLLSIDAAAASADAAVFQYLDASEPGPRSAVAYSLAGRPIREDAAAALEQQFRTWNKEGAAAIVDYETALLSLIKLGENPADYRGMDLLSALSPQDALKDGGLEGVTGALAAYSASGLEISQSQPNSPNALIDRIIAAQQRTGGFAEAAGEEPSVTVTARVLTALFPCQSGSDVRSTANRALQWLGGEQNSDGTFSVKGLPSGEATAEALLAVSLYAPDPALFASGGLPEALERFRCDDGGYSEILGGASSVAVTELAAIALQTRETGRFPYYAPQRYPGYVEPAAPEEPAGPWGSYGRFVIGFAAVFFIIYLLLILTIKIGKIAEKKKLPGSLAAQAEKERIRQSPEKRDETIQMHIPMQAEIPDFAQIPENESEIGHPDEDTAD